MNNWKRIIAAAGTAALLISNMGSVTQAVFADDDYKEQITLSDQDEDDSEASTEDEISTTGLDGEGEPAEGGDNTSGTEGQEQGESGDQNDDSQDDDEYQQDDGQNDAQGQNGNGNQGGDQENGNGSQQGGENNGSEDSADDVNGQNGNTGSEGTENSENNANGQGGFTDSQNTENAGDTTDKKDGAEDGKKVSHALSDSLKVTIETRESSKRDVTRDDDGAYLYDLGETASTTITLSNPEDYTLEKSDDAVVRVYMQFTDAEPTEEDALDAEAEEQEADDADSQDDADSNDSEDDADKADSDDENDVDEDEKESASESKSDWHDDYDPSVSHGKTHKTGEFTIKADVADGEEANEYSYTVAEIEDGLYCYEIERPIDADTITLDVTSVYKEESYGGENHIWYVALTADEAEAHSKSDVEVPEDKDLAQMLRWANDSKEKEDTSEIHIQSAQTKNYMVSVAYGPEADIPEDAKLRVIEFDEFSDEYQEAVEKSGRAIGWLLDVAFYAGDTEIEPADYIGISVAELRPFGDGSTNYEDWDESDAAEIEKETEEKAKALLEQSAEKASAEDSNSEETDESSETSSVIHFAESGIETVSTIEETEETSAATFAVDSLSLLAQDLGNAVNNVNEYEVMPVADATQPDYDQSTQVSEAIEERVIQDGLEGVTVSEITAASDKATSNIEDQFNGTSDQDGKILTDKSVVYGHDDYGAFDTYDDGIFGVTLSALGQEYEKEIKDSYNVPVDVVFVLDVSGSMRNSATDGDSTTRRQAMVDAVNSVMHSLLDGDENKNNRVGIAVFSSGSSELLSLDRYSAGNNNQFITLNGNNVQTVRNVSNSAGRTVAVTSGTATQAGGTYTQSGIARGAQIFNNIGNDTTCEVTTKLGNTLTVNRQPVYILISDGEPTHCTNNYSDVLTATSYGSGNYTQTTNAKGIMGYYTILSANYYKQQVSNQYGQNATFYSVGWGINSEGGSNYSGDQSASSAYYKRAVLDPKPGNVTPLENDNTTGIDTENTSQMLYKLLNSTYSGDQVYVGMMGDAGNLGTTNHDWANTHYVPVVRPNPYSSYSYANGSSFGNFSASDLTTYLNNVIKESSTPKEYSFGLLNNSGVTLSDPIGTGMEIKGAPILNYGGQNFKANSTSTSDNPDGSKTITYVYGYTRTYKQLYPDNYDSSNGTPNTGDHHKASDTLDMSYIEVKVTTSASGNQTISMVVPAELMPVYYPDDTKSFYYHEDPIRLIYQVGLTEKAKEEINNLPDGESKSYYANVWEGGSASGTFSLDNENPYGYSSPDGNKEPNASSTSETYFTESKSDNAVTQNLGNNGKLTFKKKAKDIIVKKVWKNGDGSEITGEALEKQPAITASLYQVDSYQKDPVQDESVTLTLQVYYRTSSGNNLWNYTTATLSPTYTVKKGGTFSATTVAYRNDYRDISYANVQTGSATINTSGRNITISNITQNTTVLIAFTRRVNSQPTVKDVTYDVPQSTPGSSSLETKKIGDSFTLSSSNDWTKFWAANDLNEQNGHTYKYYVVEEKIGDTDVSGNKAGNYTVSVDYGQDNPLTRTNDNKTITITNTQDTTSLKVNKVWDDGGIDHSKDSVTVWLYRDGVKTDRSVVLNNDNNWTATFDNLAIVDPNDSTHIYSYSVQEEAVSGYEASYSTTSGSSSTGEYIWLPAAGFEDGKTYLIVTSDSTGSVIGMEAKSDGSGFAWTSANNAGTITVSSNETYPRYITDEEAEDHTAMQWTAKSVGQIKGEQVGYRNAFTLQNVATKLYAKDTGQGDLTSDANGKEMYWYYGYTAIDAEGETAKRKPSNDSSDWDHIIGSMNDYFPLDNNHTGDANSQKAQKFYLYERVEATSSATTIIITNKKTYELPETGGAGALPIELGGSAAMLTAMFVGYSRRRRDRKEGET